MSVQTAMNLADPALLPQLSPADHRQLGNRSFNFPFPLPTSSPANLTCKQMCTCLLRVFQDPRGVAFRVKPQILPRFHQAWRGGLSEIL